MIITTILLSYTSFKGCLLVIFIENGIGDLNEAVYTLIPLGKA